MLNLCCSTHSMISTFPWPDMILYNPLHATCHLFASFAGSVLEIVYQLTCHLCFFAKRLQQGRGEHKKSECFLELLREQITTLWGTNNYLWERKKSAQTTLSF